MFYTGFRTIKRHGSDQRRVEKGSPGAINKLSPTLTNIFILSYYGNSINIHVTLFIRMRMSVNTYRRTVNESVTCSLHKLTTVTTDATDTKIFAVDNIWLRNTILSSINNFTVYKVHVIISVVKKFEKLTVSFYPVGFFVLLWLIINGPHTV